MVAVQGRATGLGGGAEQGSGTGAASRGQRLNAEVFDRGGGQAVCSRGLCLWYVCRKVSINPNGPSG
jgi:hypothetical protein